MLKSSLCDYSDAYIFVRGTITVVRKEVNDRNNKEVIFENCAQFTNCISELNNAQVDNEKGLDIVMLLYNLINCNYNYAKTKGSLW